MTGENANKVEEKRVKLSRDEVRAQIFKHRMLKTKEIEFLGVDIEMRQPTLADVMEVKESVGSDGELAVIQMLIKYSYVPGTDEKVFEPGDVESFKRMPFDGDFLKVAKTLEELSDVNFHEAKPGSSATPNE